MVPAMKQICFLKMYYFCPTGVVGENVFAIILLLLFPLPIALIHWLCLLTEGENISGILLSNNIFKVCVFQNPISCKYDSSSSYGKAWGF